jgi:segregation and condensation protein B
MNEQADTIRNVVECALLAAGEPVSTERLLMLFDDGDGVDRGVLRDAIARLHADYETRGLELKEVASGWRVQVREQLAPWVSRLWEARPPKYSRALLETLALIAYQQPVTRGDIEQVRGVSVSSNIIKTLLDRDWIHIVGHRDVPGKPALYGTTRGFLDYFDLRSLDKLPPLAELRDLSKINEELGFEPDVVAAAEGEDGAPDEGDAEVVPLRAVLGRFEDEDQGDGAHADATAPDYADAPPAAPDGETASEEAGADGDSAEAPVESVPDDERSVMRGAEGEDADHDDHDDRDDRDEDERGDSEVPRT